jgi:hypothetical protein
VDVSVWLSHVLQQTLEQSSANSEASAFDNLDTLVARLQRCVRLRCASWRRLLTKCGGGQQVASF